MHISKLLDCDETCFPFSFQTPKNKKSKEILKTPPRKIKQLISKPIFCENQKECDQKNNQETTATKGFWIKFDQTENSTEEDEYDLEKSSVSSCCSEVNDDFFEFEIDENGNWSSVEKEVISEDEEEMEEESQMDEVYSKKNETLKMDSTKNTTLGFVDKFKTTLNKNSVMINKNDKNDISKKKVSSLKDLKNFGLVNSFRSLNSSIVFDFCKNMSLIIG